MTGITGPENPAASMLAMTVAPTLRGLSLAPITATEVGAKRWLRLRIVMAGKLLSGTVPRTAHVAVQHETVTAGSSRLQARNRRKAWA